MNSEVARALRDGENIVEVRGRGTGQEGGKRRAGLPLPGALVGWSESLQKGNGEELGPLVQRDPVTRID